MIKNTVTILVILLGITMFVGACASNPQSRPKKVDVCKVSDIDYTTRSNTSVITCTDGRSFEYDEKGVKHGQ
jgi:uncharacterized lipoprotein YajG